MTRLTPQNKKHKKARHQQGNVFFMILIGVFLFGALMYSFSRGGQEGTSNITKQQAKVAAQEILNYARILEGAVDRVRRNGCSESDINFNNNTVGGYSNASAPVDQSCDIFNGNGGKATYAPPSSNWGNASQWFFNSAFQVNDVGSTCASASCADLAITLEGISSTICQNINTLLSIDAVSIPTDSDYNATKFTGAFTVPIDIADEAGSTDLSGKNAGCFYSTGDSAHVFYQVLLAR